MVDRRNMQPPLSPDSKSEINPLLLDRFRYDQDSDDDETPPVYLVDHFDALSMRYRAVMLSTQRVVRPALASAMQGEAPVAAAVAAANAQKAAMQNAVSRPQQTAS
jgi:hypothetical protein